MTNWYYIIYINRHYLHAIISLTILSRKYYSLSPPPGFKRSVINLNNRLETHPQNDAPGVKKDSSLVCAFYMICIPFSWDPLNTYGLCIRQNAQIYAFLTVEHAVLVSSNWRRAWSGLCSIEERDWTLRDVNEEARTHARSAKHHGTSMKENTSLFHFTSS